MKKHNFITALMLIIAVLLVVFLHIYTDKDQRQGVPVEQKEEQQTPAKDTQALPESKEEIQAPASPQRSLKMRYDSAIAYADSLFKAEAYKPAQKAYLRSLKIMENPYPYKQIRKIETLLAEQKKKEAQAPPKKEKKVLVKGGTFEMKLHLNNDSVITRKIKLNSFYINKYEVTVAEYRKYCEETGHKMPKEPTWGWEDNHPIVNVTWNDAMEYAKWAGKRLPTNAEWQFAASGGQNSKNYKYSGSNKIDEVGWYWQNAEKKTHPTGTKKPNELGIYDMTGNAWEWVMDWYDEDYLKNGPTDNPIGSSKGNKKILRGGSWYSYKKYCELSYMSNGSPDYRYVHIGFRLAWDKNSENN